MPAAPSACEPLIGDHPSMAALRDLVGRVARSKASIVLIYGETGTGKGLVARNLHAQSARAAKGYTEINCAAIPGNLLESELFGHERGAFTGAVARKTGLLEAANGGSVFLDEIRELDPVMQAKILTLLDSRRFRRIGSVQEVSVDARFIAATNKILLGEVQAGRFRDDLYYRLQVVSINLPPLRERGDDVILLAQHFLDDLNREGKTAKRFAPEALAAMRGYSWPGNVRELRNFVYRSYILADDVIKGDFNAFDLDEQAPAQGAEILVPVGVPLADANRQLILATLKQCGGVKKLAAETLGISIKTLYNRLEEYGELSETADQ